jgi:hypothetical protein
MEITRRGLFWAGISAVPVSVHTMCAGTAVEVPVVVSEAIRNLQAKTCSGKPDSRPFPQLWIRAPLNHFWSRSTARAAAVGGPPSGWRTMGMFRPPHGPGVFRFRVVR